MSSPERPGKDEVRAKLKAFLRQGDSEDVASLLVHALNHRADKMAGQKPADQKTAGKRAGKPAGKPKKNH